jgi:hypothetical protein
MEEKKNMAKKHNGVTDLSKLLSYPKLSKEVSKDCNECSGLGEALGYYGLCPRCGGSGIDPKYQYDGKK